MSDRKIDGNKIASLAVKGFKRAMSSTVGEEVYVAKRIKARGYDLYANFRDFGFIIWNSILIVFYAIIGLFRLIIDAPHAFRRASQNNFRLGLEDLKAGNLIDARIRFLLSNMFYSKSATTKYYIAYVYFLQENYKTSLKYLKQSINIDSNDDRVKALLSKIEEALGEKTGKVDFHKQDNNQRKKQTKNAKNTKNKDAKQQEEI